MFQNRNGAIKSRGTALIGASLLMLAVAACASETLSPTPLGTVRPTAAMLPTAIQEATPIPTQPVTPVPTRKVTQPPTQAPPPTTEPTPNQAVALNAIGPWLIFVRDEGFEVSNPDGTGRTLLFASKFQYVPEDWLIRIDDWWDYSISETGWVAAIVPGDEASDGEPMLLLTKLPNTEAVREVPILAAEISASLEEDMVGLWADIHLALGEELQPLSWSPDNRYLAFAAAVEGLSVDLYVYDTRLDQVIRLTDGPNQPDFLGWSPDGRWVVHREVRGLEYQEGGIGYENLGVWAAAVDGSGARRVPDVSGRFGIRGWISPTQFVAVHSPGHPYLDPWSFEVIDIDRGPVTFLYEGYFHDFDLDTRSGTLAVIVPADPGRMKNPLPAGLYLISVKDGVPRLVTLQESLDDTEFDDAYSVELKWSALLDAFLLTTPTGKLLAISPQGEVAQVSEGACDLPAVSPDGKWAAYDSCLESDGPHVQDLLDGRVIEIPAERTISVRWLLDSSGFYYIDRGYLADRLMFIVVPEGIPRLIHPDPGYYDPITIVGGLE